MKECVIIRSKPLARALHCQLITTGLDFSTFVQNNLVNLYAGCGLIDDASLVFNEIELKNVFSWNTMIKGLIDSGRVTAAEMLFDEMPQRDVVSWNSMMSGYFHNGLPENTVEVFISMVRCFNSPPDALSLTCVMKACASLKNLSLAFQLHSFAEKFKFLGDNDLESSIVDMYIKCGAPEIAEHVFLNIPTPNLFSWNSMIHGYSILHGAQRALELFDEMPKRNVVSWNMIISILSKHGHVTKTLGMFIEMCIQGFRPNSMTYASVLSACTSMHDLPWGIHLHGRIVRMQQHIDAYIATALIDMYAKCGHYKKARQIFNNLKEHNIVSWTSMIGGATHCGNELEAFSLFKQMKEIPIPSDQFTLATILGACCSLKDLHLGTQIHGYSIAIGMESRIPVANALVTMYAKCGDIQNATNAFNLMPHKDIISWTTMITGYSNTGNVEKAREYFDKMPERNIISWNSMLGGYIQNGIWEEGFKLFVLMKQKGVKPDSITFITAISACANAAILKLGNQIVAQSEKLGFGNNISVKNSIITMYAKCGHIQDAKKTFDSIVSKNLISWNAIMGGYAQSGEGNSVIDTFEKMIWSGLQPDHISYVSVLSGCSHSGLLPEGQRYFKKLMEDENVSPTCEHFTCVVDLYCRAGFIEKAKDLIDNMPIKPNAAVWGALLGGCRIHGKATIAEVALKNLVVLEPEGSGSYVLLANLYSDSGMADSVSDVRRVMKEKGIRKNPGCSWIEVDNRVHVFTVDDTNHPRINDVYKKLEEIFKKIEGVGVGMYCVDKSRAYHSEKLALAFGLMSLPAWMPVHIMKNLRICDDCHVVMKLVSRVTSRELIIRDANRFHHFRDGFCSFLSALDVAKTQFYHFKAIIIAGMGLFTDSYDLFCIPPIMRMLGRIYYPEFDRTVVEKKWFEVPTVIASTMIGVALMGAVIGQLVFGRLGDLVGRRHVYGVSLIMMVVGSIGCGLSVSIWTPMVFVSLGFFRFLLGVGIGGDYPLSATIMSEFANKKTRGTFIAAVFSMQGFGILLSSLVTMIVCYVFRGFSDELTTVSELPLSESIAPAPPEADLAWRIILMIGAIPASMTYYWRMKMPETARFTALVEKNALQAAEDMEKVMNISPSQIREDIETVNTPNTRAALSNTYPFFSQEFLRRHGRDLISAAVNWFLVDIVFYSLNLFQYHAFKRKMTPKSHIDIYDDALQIAKFQALVAVCATIPGYFLAIYMIDYVGRVKIQATGFFFMAVSLFTIAYVNRGNWGSDQSVGFMILYGLTFFFSNFGPNTTTFIVPAELFPARFRATCHGVSGAVGKVGAMIGSVGFLWACRDPPDGLGVSYTLMMMGLVCVLGFFMTYFFTRETKGRSLEENENVDEFTGVCFIRFWPHKVWAKRYDEPVTDDRLHLSLSDVR
ncbi:hypothetical protein LXL04_022244 [Taraxacum kok-saghyz]